MESMNHNENEQKLIYFKVLHKENLNVLAAYGSQEKN